MISVHLDNNIGLRAMEITNQDIIAGTTLEFSESFDDYPSSDYDCQCVFKKGSDSPFNVDGTADSSDGFDFLAEAEETAKLSNGTYDFQFIFTNKTDSKVYAPREFTGSVLITSLLSSSQDTRSDDQKVLEALKTQRQKIAERDYSSMGSNGKTAQFKELSRIDADIARYERKLGYSVQPRVLTSFV